MSEGEFNEWSLSLDADALSYPLEYKFIIRLKTKRFGRRPNRLLYAPEIKNGEVWVQDDLRPRFTDPAPLRAAGAVIRYSRSEAKTAGARATLGTWKN
jgi:hypothetical protein